MRRGISLTALCGPELGFRGFRAGFSDPAFVMWGDGQAAKGEGSLASGYKMA
jgi:hypothetical protein